MEKGNVQGLFDVAELMNSQNEEHVITLSRIEGITPKPTITIRLNNEIRKKERKLFRDCNDMVLRFKGTGTRAKQEGHFITDKLTYALELVDLCIVNSAGLFKDENGKTIPHDSKYMKALFEKKEPIMNYIVDEITAILRGKVALAEEDEDKKK